MAYVESAIMYNPGSTMLSLAFTSCHLEPLWRDRICWRRGESEFPEIVLSVPSKFPSLPRQRSRRCRPSSTGPMKFTGQLKSNLLRENVHVVWDRKQINYLPISDWSSYQYILSWAQKDRSLHDGNVVVGIAITAAGAGVAHREVVVLRRVHWELFVRKICALVVHIWG